MNFRKGGGGKSYLLFYLQKSMWTWIELNSGLRVQPVLLSGFSYLASSAIPAYRAIPHVSSPHFGHFTTQPTSISSHSPFHVLNTKLEPAFHHTKYSTLKVCAFLEESWTWFKWSFHCDICKIPNSLSNILAQNFLRSVLDEIVKGLCQTST